MKEFVAEKKIVLGTTQHNSSIIEPGLIHHGGGGKTYIGSITGDGNGFEAIEETFNKCGLNRNIDNIQRRIWEKLFVHVSASALTAILQTKLGFSGGKQTRMVFSAAVDQEAVAVANAEGMDFEEDKIAEDVHRLLEKAKDGYTSIYADIRDGRKTEVDTISGAVVSASRRNYVAAPGHEFVVGLIHALEDKGST